MMLVMMGQMLSTSDGGVKHISEEKQMSARIATLLMDAMRPDPWRGVRLPTGTIVATDSAFAVVDGLRTVCTALGWSIAIHDADRTNLFDIRESRSPLAQSITHSMSSERQWLFVLRGSNRALLDDPRYATLLDQWGRSARFVVVTDELGDRQEDWSKVRIDAEARS